MMKIVSGILVTLCFIGVAQANILTNASFEDATYDDYGALVPDNWNVWSDTWNGTWNQVTDGTAYDALAQWELVCNAGLVVGSQAAYVSGTGEIGTVSFMIRNDGNLDAGIEIGVDYGPTDFSAWWGDDHKAFTAPADGQWYLYSYEITLWDVVGVSPKVAIFAGDESGMISVDAASFTVIPEPASLALLVLGGLLLRRRSR